MFDLCNPRRRRTTREVRRRFSQLVVQVKPAVGWWDRGLAPLKTSPATLGGAEQDKRPSAARSMGVLGRARLSKAVEINSKMTLRIAGLGAFAPGFEQMRQSLHDAEGRVPRPVGVCGRRGLAGHERTRRKRLDGFSRVPSTVSYGALAAQVYWWAF
jgi:hypothetical protein